MFPLSVSTHASRRLAFESPGFYSRTPGCSVPPDGDVFVPESPERDACWRPGQALPLPVHHSTPQLDLRSILQDMQGCMERNFTEVKDHLANLEARVADLEVKQNQLEVQNASSSTSSETETRRKCRSPSELQVTVLTPNCSRVEITLYPA